jgi:hypothetical protein
MWFKCKITGNVYFFQYEADILSMKEHHEYECLGETLPEDKPKVGRPKKVEE